MKRTSILAMLAAAPCLVALPRIARAADSPSQTAITNLFTAPAAEQFAPAFLAQYPYSVIKSVVDAFNFTLGPLQSVAPISSKTALLTFAKGTSRAEYALDGQGRFTTIALYAAQGATLRATLEKLLKADSVDASWFSKDFLASIPATRVNSLLGGLHASNGALQSIDTGPSGYIANFERGRLGFDVMTDVDGKIVTLAYREA